MHVSTGWPALPKLPVLDWSSLGAALRPDSSLTGNSIEAVSQQIMTTSGRAALFQALCRLKAAPGRSVLVPTYHCPSMVAPILRAGLQPMFYGLQGDGSPRLDEIVLGGGERPVAMVAAHLFGLPLPFEATRAWCDTNDVILIEDCAHCFFGQAGARAVGQWGDYAFASLTKFFPVPEAGLLVSNRRPLESDNLSPPSLRAQLKGFVDVLEFASRHGRLRGVATLLRAIFAVKNALRRGRNGMGGAESPHDIRVEENRTAIDCDMGRVSNSPLWISRQLFARQDRARLFMQRRDNYLAYANGLKHVAGAKALQPTLPVGAAPYVFPLLVDDADRVYHTLRLQGMPVFRWDRVWPQTPVLPNDFAPHWRQHLLQLLCHQDLSVADIGMVCRAVSHELSTTGSTARVEPKPA